MTIAQAVFLLFSGTLAGALNAVAGGGSFVAFPALLFTGVPAIPANATNTLALWVGVAASGGAYRRRMNFSWRLMAPLILMCVIGSVIGAAVLIRTPPRTFLHVIPWLMLGATLLFAFGKRLTSRFPIADAHEASTVALCGASLYALMVAIYGGYFGGGMGIMTLAMLAALGMTDIHAMNALKLVLSGVINGVATIMFVVMGVIYWPQAIVTTAGAILGGYLGAHYAQKLPQSVVRGFVICVGFAMSIYLFVIAYR